MRPWRFAAGTLLAALLVQPVAAWAWYARLTAPFTIDGTNWPAGTYVPVARDAGNAWLMRATTTSPRIPKAVSELIPRWQSAGSDSVGIDDRCWSYEVKPEKSHPGTSIFDPTAVKYHIQPFIGAQLIAKEGDAYIINMRNPKPGPNELSRLPLHCVTFRNGGKFVASYASQPFPANDLVDDTPFGSSPWVYGLAGGIVLLIAARFLIYGRG